MYAYLKGILTHSSSRHVILETCGIGFFVQIPVSLFSKLPPLGSTFTLHTSYIVREDSQTLYGFSSLEEKQLFEDLIGISGIGPKTALSLVGHMQIADFQAAIQANQVQLICKIPGVGKKTAERLVMELKDKVSSKNIHTNPLFDDVASALANLGYSPQAVEKAVKKILNHEEKPTELGDLITLALRLI